jgi:orotidine-5'-phosphate decarboxylase
MERLSASWEKNRIICVGLDSAMSALPKVAHRGSNPQLWFNRRIIDSTIDGACAYKLNLGFYLETGTSGLEALNMTVASIRDRSAEVPIILDGKFGDIGNTNSAYASFAFDHLGVDAVTLSPYVGGESLGIFLDYSEKGSFVLSRTSNAGAEEFQGVRRFQTGGDRSPEPPLYEVVATAVARRWNSRGNCGIVVGATVPSELQQCRALVGDMPILVPGVGAQGGDLLTTLSVGRATNSTGLVVNVSRALLFASANEDFAEAAASELDVLNQSVELYLTPT